MLFNIPNDRLCLALRIIFHIQLYIVKFQFNTFVTMTHWVNSVQQSGNHLPIFLMF